MVLVLYAHPYPDRSHANRVLVAAISNLEKVTIRSLYDLYPDFSIDVAAEQDALAQANAIVLQYPTYWYTAPALMKLWFEKVLTDGWAFGREGNALRGKRCLLVTTTGGDAVAYSSAGIHRDAYEAFVPPIRRTAQLCKMHFEEPFVVHAARNLPSDEMMMRAEAYRDRVVALLRETGGV